MRGAIALIRVDSPPVNALGRSVRDGIFAAAMRARGDANAKAIVLICAGKTFIAGADIREFGKPPEGTGLLEVEGALENS
ncbi:MAG TPA: enoyl-CoA hydratase-related protein, partial [Polyangiales bacterium]|nr:enoyl-CoA hydratase-related protein [Polyangiales bacterium]